MDSYRQVFATLFWFTVLPGPAGAVLYRAAALLAEEWQGDAKGADTTPIAQARAVFGRPARTLLFLLDWVPARLTALSFAIVGDFEDAVFCWRTQASSWAGEDGGEHAGIVLASGAGALGVLVGGPVPVVGAEPEERPELGLGDAARSGPPAERGRAHLARARAVAPADAAAHPRELGAVVLERSRPDGDHGLRQRSAAEEVICGEPRAAPRGAESSRDRGAARRGIRRCSSCR